MRGDDEVWGQRGVSPVIPAHAGIQKAANTKTAAARCYPRPLAAQGVPPLDTPVFLAVMAAAVLHAGWNALLKIGLDRFLTITLIEIGAGLLALLALPFVAFPEAHAWPWILLSALLHIGYNTFLARAYQHGDLGQAYPIARGSSPLMVAGLSILLLHDRLSAGQFAGLLVLVGGIWLMAVRGGRHRRLPGALLGNALLTSAFIAGYTLADAAGARANGDALSYSVWLFAVNGLVMVLVIGLLRGPGVWRSLGGHWRGGLAGGLMSMAAYSIVIWAMTQAPVALVSALRESSVVFALLIGWRLLKEPLPAMRVLACLVIAVGVAAVKLA
ncbi:hypothetical protein D9M68_580440 [compost metagenome]